MAAEKICLMSNWSTVGGKLGPHILCSVVGLRSRHLSSYCLVSESALTENCRSAICGQSSIGKTHVNYW